MTIDSKTKYRLMGMARKLHRWHPSVRDAEKRARIAYDIYCCEGCGDAMCLREDGFSDEEAEAFAAHDMQLISIGKCVDHIEPVVDPERGWTSWDDYFERLFCEAGGLQILCQFCHSSKTQVENGTRTSIRRSKKNESAN